MSSYNAIGAFNFDMLSGQVSLAKQRPRIYQRGGVSGTGLFWDGRKGRPFGLRSGVALADRDTGIIRGQQYKELCGYLVDEIYQADQVAATYGQFAVLDVEVDAGEALLTTVGTALPGARFWLGARWVLIHIAN